ncbi:MAG: hypothetical protein JSV25_04605 [Spirochaetota bacterium]|nr:MAG: hypothetical protein JSV25_04605 [Spirochaetota bacterium]
MKKESITNVFSIMLIISGILSIIWWLLLGISQMAGGSGGSLSQLVQSSSWIPINIIGLVALLLLVMGLMRILFDDESNLGSFGFLGFIICIFGVVLFTSLQFDETFVWPLLAKYADSLLEIEGPMFTNPAFSAAYIIMGILYVLGFIFIAIQALRRDIFPKIPSILMIVGAPMFGAGLLVPSMVRTAGIILLGVSFAWIGFFKFKRAT